jgi:hypothetical protein
MLHHAFWQVLSNISEELTATIVGTVSTRLHDATSQKTAIFILIIMRIQNLNFSYTSIFSLEELSYQFFLAGTANSVSDCVLPRSFCVLCIGMFLFVVWVACISALLFLKNVASKLWIWWKCLTYYVLLVQDHRVYEVSEGARLHFVKFETKYIESCLDFVQVNLVNTRDKMVGKSIKATGGGAYKYTELLQQKLGLS